jgi:hypothetical protein
MCLAESKGSDDVAVGSEPPRNIVISWAGEPQETEEIERDGRKISVPRYGVRRVDDDCLEREVPTPAVLIEHAAAVASEPEPAASSSMEALSVVP